MNFTLDNKAIKAPTLAILAGSSPSVAAATDFAYTNSNRVVVVKAQTLPALAGTIPVGSVGTFVLEGDSEGNLGFALGYVSTIAHRQVFTTSGVTTLPESGAVYSNNSQKFTFRNAVGVNLAFVATGAPAASGTLTLVSGNGPATITFASSLVSTVVNYVGTPAAKTYPLGGYNLNVPEVEAGAVKYSNGSRSAIAFVTVMNESAGSFVAGTTALDVSGITVIYSSTIAGY